MRYLNIPRMCGKELYELCVQDVADSDQRERMRAISNDISEAAAGYAQQAVEKELYMILPDTHSDSEIVVGEVTKEELKSLYDDKLVKGKKAARAVYDRLRASAPFGRCPYCGIGQVYTLDHYLPKAKFPKFSVLPDNLVPACRDCNSGKSSAVATSQAEQVLHPYFDDYEGQQWLYAEVVEQTQPASVRFYVNTPDGYDPVAQARFKRHFIDFDLANRCGNEAASELAFLRIGLQVYRDTQGVAGVREHLASEGRNAWLLHRNWWKTALYQALSNSDWYCDIGFSGQ